MAAAADVQDSSLLGCGTSDLQVHGAAGQGEKGDSSFRKCGRKETEKIRGGGQKDLTKVSFLSKKRKLGESCHDFRLRARRILLIRVRI